MINHGTNRCCGRCEQSNWVESKAVKGISSERVSCFENVMFWTMHFIGRRAEIFEILIQIISDVVGQWDSWNWSDFLFNLHIGSCSCAELVFWDLSSWSAHPWWSSVLYYDIRSFNYTVQRSWRTVTGAILTLWQNGMLLSGGIPNSKSCLFGRASSGSKDSSFQDMDTEVWRRITWYCVKPLQTLLTNLLPSVWSQLLLKDALQVLVYQFDCRNGHM